ncbi:MAG: diacylglycerol kinase family protein [Candidatus Saganbacteria bacterium]|nr:diacylglycerol kinase family protein [Candidatus Saganbacteria bacterium]
MPRKFITSMRYAQTGIRYLWRTQRNFRIHILIALAALLLGMLLEITLVEFMALFLSIFFVIVTETMNTAVEEAVNLAVITKKARAMVSKDVAAASVLLSSLCAIIIGFLIFGPRLWGLLHKVVGG